MSADAVRRLASLARRAGDVLAREGARGLLARARRRLSSDERRVFARYRTWLARHERERPPGGDRPLVSIVTPVKDPPVPVLRALARSVLGQEGARVEWCVADDGSERPQVRRELERLAESDTRVRLVRLASGRGISAATNAALERARGELVAFVDHDDVLDRHALAWMQRAFDDPLVGAAYSDEDKLDASGKRRAPFFKPAFSPDLLLSGNYVSHLFVARRSLVRELGPFSSDLDGAQDLDLALRLSERARIAHVPRVLYHWRMVPGSTAERANAKPWAHEAARRAVEAALARRGDRATVEPGAWPGAFWIRRELARPLDVSVVLVGGRAAGARRWAAVAGVREVLASRGDAGDVARALRESGGSLCLVVARDLEPAPGALEELAAHAQRAGVAVVAPRVLSSAGELESAGLTLGFGHEGLAACPFRGRDADDPGYFGLARSTRDVSAVSASAFAIERAKLEVLGGLAADQSLRWVGVDLAARARASGQRTVLAGEAVFTQRGSTRAPASRGLGAVLEASASTGALRARLGALLLDEPNLSPHFRRGVARLEL